MRPVRDQSAWEDYLWWQAQDRRTLKRLNLLIQDVMRNGNEGLGKPEPLKHDFAGYWSRRITDEHRLVCKVLDDEVRKAACPLPPASPGHRGRRAGRAVRRGKSGQAELGRVEATHASLGVE